MRWSWHTARLSINKLVIPETVFVFSNTNWQIKLKQNRKHQLDHHHHHICGRIQFPVTSYFISYSGI